MTKYNIENLTSLWQISLENSFKKDDQNGINYGWVENADWPNRIWIDEPLSPQALVKIGDIVKNAPDELTYSYFDLNNNEQEKLIREYGFLEKTRQYGMFLELTDQFDYTPRLQLKQVKDYRDSQIWCDVFFKSFQYVISPATVFNTKHKVSYFIAYLNKEEVGTVVLYLTEKVAGIHSLGVIPQIRKMGYGKEITLFALNQAIAANASISTLQASEIAKSMYMGLGYTQHFILRNYQLPTPD